MFILEEYTENIGWFKNRLVKTWNLKDSLGKKDLVKSVNIFKNLLLNGVSLIPIIISLSNFYFELINKSNNQYNGLNK